MGRLIQQEKPTRSVSPKDSKSPSPCPPSATVPPGSERNQKPIPEPSPQFEKRIEAIVSKVSPDKTASPKQGLRDFPSRSAGSSRNSKPDSPGDKRSHDKRGKSTSARNEVRPNAPGGDRFANFLSQENAFQSSRKTLSTSQVEKNMEKRLAEMTKP